MYPVLNLNHAVLRLLRHTLRRRLVRHRQPPVGPGSPTSGPTIGRTRTARPRPSARASGRTRTPSRSTHLDRTRSRRTRSSLARPRPSCRKHPHRSPDWFHHHQPSSGHLLDHTVSVFFSKYLFIICSGVIRQESARANHPNLRSKNSTLLGAPLAAPALLARPALPLAAHGLPLAAPAIVRPW